MGALLDAAFLADRQNPVYGARLIQSGSGQSCASTTFTTIVYGAIEYDTSGSAITGYAAGTGKLTANRTGLWAVSGTLSFSVASGYWVYGAIIRNGNTSDIGAEDTASAPAAGASFQTTVNVSTVLRLAVGDYVTLIADQNTGVAQTTNYAHTSFQMAFLGPA